MATSSTVSPAVDSAVADAVASEPDAAEYPERVWIAQSLWHGDAVRLATDALQHYFKDREDVLVAMELVVYYERGNDHRWLQPDVQVVFGVAPVGNLSSFKVWEKGKAPDFVLEVASPSTAERDATYKAKEYARIGVREYWRLDPAGSIMEAPLEGYRASGDGYGAVEPVGRTGDFEYLQSDVLGLHLRAARWDGATVLVFRDPDTGEEFRSSLEESERKRKLAEARARASQAREKASQAREKASREELTVARNRIRSLERRLSELTGPSDPMGQDC